jgi:hypothetical protein
MDLKFALPCIKKRLYTNTRITEKAHGKQAPEFSE